MELQFDTITVVLVAAIALLVGYAAGGIRWATSGTSAPPEPMRPLTRRERDEVVALLVQGGAIPAIRRIRELTGVDLKQAHEAVTFLEQELGPRKSLP